MECSYKMVMITLVILYGIFSPIYTIKLEHADCGKKEISEIRSFSCDSDPCKIPVAGNVVFEVDITPKETIHKPKFSFFGKMMFMEMPLDLEDDDACAKGIQCPMKKGVTQTLKYKLTIPDSIPAISANVGVRFTGKDDKDKEIIFGCSTIYAEIYSDQKDEL